MQFCLNCESVLFPVDYMFYCKACKRYFILKGEKLIRYLMLDETEETHERIELDVSEDELKTVSNKEFYNEKHLSYHHFFPYDEYREEQEEIIAKIEEATKEKKIVLLSAPNGTGKTIIALSALLPIAMEKNLKILYLCRTHAQNSRVIKELIKISKFIKKNELNYEISGLSIRGRNEMCLNKTLLSMNLDHRDAMTLCGDLRKNRKCRHFVNLTKKRDKFENPSDINPELFRNPVDAETIISYCDSQDICPYFLSKSLLKEMNLIVCNYQWVFNPAIQENFLSFIDRELKDCIIVVDECHNIIDVATDANSMKISTYLLDRCDDDIKRDLSNDNKMISFIKILRDDFNKKKNEISFEEPINAEKYLNKILKRMSFNDLNELKKFLKDLIETGIGLQEERMSNGKVTRNFLGALAEFWLKWLKIYNQDNYFFCFSVRRNKKGNRNINLEIVALEPRDISIPILKEAFSSINLSGTVNPYVFTHLMGLNKSGKPQWKKIAESPFERKHVKAIITDDIDTKRENRTPYMFKKMIDKIDQVISCTPANSAVFCASYKILNGLLDNGIRSMVEKKHHKQFFVEEPGLSASENALLINDYKSCSTNSGALLLGVCGGRNSEGEDYPGDFMNSVIIAGFPYHLPTPRVEAKIKYYDKVFEGQGWNFAYLYPAIQRANQASGRPIRRATDKGALIFMDSRFKDKQKWISEWVRRVIEVIDNKEDFQTCLEQFWNSS